jgi:glycosyltransferase involved in cell wall biosynthesis
MPSRPSIIFYGNAVGEDLIAERAIVSDSPAATRKMTAVCLALRTAGLRPLMVSMGRGRTGCDKQTFKARCGRIGRIPVVYGPLRPDKLTSLPTTVLWLCGIALRLSRRRGVVHLFYNQLLLYLPALAILRLRGSRTALDLEDGPTGVPIPAHRGNAPDSLFAPFINSGSLIACRALSEATTIRPTLPVYGSIAGCVPLSTSDQRDVLEVLYSGSIQPDAGSDMLIDAVHILRQATSARPIRIHVTGSGPGLQSLTKVAGDDRGVEVQLHGRAPLHVYQALLAQCSVGLSLKLARGPYAQTTFPSKTIEYAEYGLALVTTDISDVRGLFGDSALYIHDDSAQALADHLIWLSRHPVEQDEILKSAHERLTNSVSQTAVGAAIREFFFKGREL